MKSMPSLIEALLSEALSESERKASLDRLRSAEGRRWVERHPDWLPLFLQATESAASGSGTPPRLLAEEQADMFRAVTEGLSLRRPRAPRFRRAAPLVAMAAAFALFVAVPESRDLQTKARAPAAFQLEWARMEDGRLRPSNESAAGQVCSEERVVFRVHLPGDASATVVHIAPSGVETVVTTAVGRGEGPALLRQAQRLVGFSFVGEAPGVHGFELRSEGRVLAVDRVVLGDESTCREFGG